jgi:drug/metabolite transporter (DMT)-like permease
MIIVFLLCGTIFSLIYTFLTDSAYINRILPFWQTFALLLFVLFYQISAAVSTYLRCFRKEPLMYPYIIGALLVVIGSLWAGINYSSSGIVVVMLAAQGLIVFPASIFICKKCKQSWIK